VQLEAKLLAVRWPQMPVHASMTVTLGLIAQKAGSHRYVPTDELRESAKIDMCLCNPAIKLPVAALMQPYRIHPSEQIPYRNPAISGTGTDQRIRHF